MGTISNSSNIVGFALSVIAMKIATQRWWKVKSPITALIGGALIVVRKRWTKLMRDRRDGIRIIKMNIRKDRTVSILSIFLYVTNARDVLGNRTRSQETLQDQADEYWAFGKPTQKC